MRFLITLVATVVMALKWAPISIEAASASCTNCGLPSIMATWDRPTIPNLPASAIVKEVYRLYVGVGPNGCKTVNTSCTTTKAGYTALTAFATADTFAIGPFGESLMDVLVCSDGIWTMGGKNVSIACYSTNKTFGGYIKSGIN